MRIAASVVAVGLVALIGLSARAGSSPPLPTPTVPCDEVILRVGSGRAGGYRVVLGVISVPPAHLAQVVTSGGQTWPYWRKAGLVIRQGAPAVTVSVPKTWRDRAAITWGNSTGIVSSLRIASCPGQGPKRWNAYAGGFYLRSRSACVPLSFRVGQRTATVRFGLGRVCGPAG